MKKYYFLNIFMIMMMVSSCGNKVLNRNTLSNDLSSNDMINNSSENIEETEQGTKGVYYVRYDEYVALNARWPCIVFCNDGTCEVGALLEDVDIIYSPIESAFCTYEFRDNHVIVSFDEGEGMLFFDLDNEGTLIYNQGKSIENKRISILFKDDKIKLKALVPSEAIF